MFARHNKELTHHATSFADILLHELSARDTDEAALRVVRDSTCKQCLAGSWWAVEENTLWLSNSQSFEDLWVLDWKLDDFFDLLDLFVDASNHLVGTIRSLLDAHELDEWVNLARQNLVQHIAVAAESNASIGLAVFNVDILVDVNHILALLSNLDEHLLLAHGLDD